VELVVLWNYWISGTAGLVELLDWWNYCSGLVELVDWWNWWICGTGGFVELLD
jgi:hypothetical protein